MANLLVILIQVFSLARIAPSRPHGFLTMQSTHIQVIMCICIYNIVYPACSRWKIHQCQYLRISSLYHSIYMASWLWDMQLTIAKKKIINIHRGCNTAHWVPPASSPLRSFSSSLRRKMRWSATGRFMSTRYVFVCPRIIRYIEHGQFIDDLPWFTLNKTWWCAIAVQSPTGSKW